MSDASWEPSKGQWGIFGSDAGSKEGQRRRGKAYSGEAGQLIKESDKNLELLLKQFNRAQGPDSIYAKQMELEQDQASLAGEGFLEEADRQAAAMRAQTETQTQQIETQQAKQNFAGSGSTGRAREQLAQTIRDKGGDIYSDLTTKRASQDLELEKKGIASEHEQHTELDRIEGEARGIASQTRQALLSMENTKTSYSPNPGLDKFTRRPGDAPPAAAPASPAFNPPKFNINLGDMFN